MPSSQHQKPINITIIGAGAAGHFCALTIVEQLKENPELKKLPIKIRIIERGRQGLRKVKISGGGRCNVTHHQYDISEFVKNYPRGHRELRGPLHQFQAEDTVKWFERHGVKLKVESDGRMFPVTDSSQTIIDCFQRVLGSSVEILYQSTITDVLAQENVNILTLSDGEIIESHYTVLATGSDPTGHKLAEAFGHSLTELAPSLFTFKVKHPLLKDLLGTTFPNVSVKLHLKNHKGKKITYQEEGPMLITHWGLSGPAILKLSAWAALELKQCQYQFPFSVNLINQNEEQAFKTLTRFKEQNPKKALATVSPWPELTQRFWQQFLDTQGLPTSKVWSEASQKTLRSIAINLSSFTFQSAGPHRNKDEFVECGGVKSKEVNFKKMQSKVNNYLYLAGEVLNIDGLTGGFNFQNAWTTSHIAGKSIVDIISLAYISHHME